MTDETPSEETQDRNLGDMLGAWKSGASSMSLERIGGGRGPGWNGSFYNGMEAQMGGPFSFEGDNLNVVLQQAMASLGGSTYRWRAQDSAGKWHSGTIVFPGEPKALPGVVDPAADAARAAAAAYGTPIGGGGMPYGGSSGAGYGSPFASSVRRLPPGWHWSQAMNGWLFADENGELSEPPPGLSPPRAPAAGLGYYQNQGLHQDVETPGMKLMREEMKELKTLLLTKAGGGSTDGLAAMILQGMKIQSDGLSAIAAADRAAAAARSTEEREARKATEEAREQVRKSERALIDKILTMQQGPGGARPQDPIRDALDKALIEKLTGGLFDGDKKDTGDDRESKMGEKIVDGLTELIQFGKTWLDKKDDKAPSPPSPNPAPPTNAPGTNHAAASNGAQMDDDTRRWLTLLDIATDAYENQRSPQAAFEMLYAGARAAQINFEKVLAALHALSGKQLLAWLGGQPEPAKSRAAPIVAAFSSGDGQAWFDKLIAHARTIPVNGGE